MARRLVVPRTARSEVWNYFGFEADESGTITDIYRRYVWCRLCDSQLLFSGNTTNLSAHIARCRKTPRLFGDQSQSIPQMSTLSNSQNVNFSEEILRHNEDHEQETSELRNASDFQQKIPTDEQDLPDCGDSIITQEQKSSFLSSDNDQQQYCLKWKFHQNNQQTMFSKLLQKESFCDVTIACEEKLLRAHKLLLSACSSYFETILSLYEDQNPIIILKDVRFEDMSALLQFMYKGEINIEQSQLASLLETADLLKIKGLSDICGEPHRSESSGQSTEFAENTKSVEETLYTSTEEQSNNEHTFDSSRIGTTRRRPVSEDGVHRLVKIPRRNIGMEVAQIIPGTGSQPHSTQHDSLVKKDYMEGIIRLPDFLKSHGSYQEFWKKPWVMKALKAVSDRKMTLRNCSDLLGVGYNILYSRYRQLHGCLKEGSYDSPGTSRSYTLKIVRTQNENEPGGKIILRRDQLSPAAALTVANQNESISDQCVEEGVTEPMVNVKLEPGTSVTEQYDCELMEDENGMLQDPGET